MTMRVLAYAICLVLLLGCRTSEPRASSSQAERTAGSDSSKASTAAPSRESRCAQLEDEIKGQFEGFLSRHRTCQASSDCTLAKTDCPLGCYWVAVNKAFQRDAEIVSDGLLKLFEGLDCGCVYKCFAPESAECFDRQCVPRAEGTRPG